MSLIRVRRNRRETGPGKIKKPPSPVRLLLLLILIGGLIWWLAGYTG